MWWSRLRLRPIGNARMADRGSQGTFRPADSGRTKRALAGTTVAVIAAATALAFATIHPPPLKARSKPGSAPQHAASGPVPTIVVQQAATPPPPTSSDFAPPKSPPSKPAEPAQPSQPGASAEDWTTMPVAELRARANGDDAAAMEELGRRLIQGTGVPKDQQAGAGWLLRAAEHGSAQSAFNVGVMYERGFVVERDSSKAAQWYRKAADAGVAVAKHNLGLLLRDGKGVPRDVKAAVALLKSAARQGMAASMYTLGDIYDRGDAGPRDAVEALAWFAVAAEFERQVNRGSETVLSKTADQRAQALQRTLTPEELARAQDRAQGEFKLIVDTLSPAKPPDRQQQAAEAPGQPPASPLTEPPAAAGPPAATTPPAAAETPNKGDLVAWPASLVDQVRAVQQLLLDLKYLHDKPDGSLGPQTRAAIRDFQEKSGLKPTGEVTKALYESLRRALTNRDVVANSPLPSPAPPQPAAPAEKPAPSPPEEPRAQAKIDLPPSEPPAPPPSAADIARAEARPDVPKVNVPPIDPRPIDPHPTDPPRPPMPPIDTTKPAPVKVELAPPSSPVIDIGTPPPPPAPPSSAEVARLAPPPPADFDAWPSKRVDQVKAIQAMLRDIKIYNAAIDGIASVATRAAIRDYERMANLKETGEPSKAVFDSLKEMRSLMQGKH